jgi:hypothetical protein
MRYISSDTELHGKYLFILNEKMATLLGPLAHSSAYSIHFLPFEKKYRNATIRSFSEWKVISQAIDQTSSIKEIIFMDVDPYLPLLATRRFRKYKLSVNGILFQPYVHFLHVKGGTFFFCQKDFAKFFVTGDSGIGKPQDREAVYIKRQSGS